MRIEEVGVVFLVAAVVMASFALADNVERYNHGEVEIMVPIMWCIGFVGAGALTVALVRDVHQHVSGIIEIH